MSLSTISAGGGFGGAAGGGGGLVMAHQANAMAQPVAQPPPGADIPGATPTGAAPPVSVAALGADLVDKNQALSMKQVRNTSHLPLVAVDIYGNDPIVAIFPPKPKEPDQTLFPTLVGKVKAQVSFKKTEGAHKTLRKFLNKDKTYESLLGDSIAPSSSTDANVVALRQPHQWLGVRRLENVPSFWKDRNPDVDKTVDPGSSSQTSIIAEESVKDGVKITNGTLDGVSAPSGDDFDRVVYKVRLAENKKALTLLPEEATSLLIANAQYHVSKKVSGTVKKQDDESEKDDPLDYPVGIAIPGWACHDAALDAWVDSTPCGAFFQRSTAALAGALLPGNTEGQVNDIIDRINRVTQAMAKAHEMKNDGTSFDYNPLLVLVGLAHGGVECTAVQISEIQTSTRCCLFGNYKVLADIAIPHAEPVTQVEKCVKDLYDKMDEVAPEVEGPVAFITYGSKADQSAIKGDVEKVRATLDTWEKVPILPTKPECVSMGTAVLGGVSHGRVTTLTQGANQKLKAQIAIRVQNVASTAVGIQMSYSPGKWTPVKTIFDFDRRVPAGPYPIELKASECAALREAKEELSDEALLKATKDIEGAKGIPKREAAALDFQVQVLQKWSRDGEWIKVGDPSSPLTKRDEDDDEKRIACESITLELSLGATGMITQSLVGELQSVVQANKSARNSKLRYYIGVLLAILFFGGFFVKSYLEERSFERDTKRLLAYYKHVIPGSLADGDENNARYLVWKYRGKRDKLWRRLEVKYGEPVRHAHEWDDYKGEEDEEEEEEVQNLDEEGEEQDEHKEEQDL